MKRPRRSLRPPPALPLVDWAQEVHVSCGALWRSPRGRPLATVRSVSGARLGVLRSACAKFGSEGSRKIKSRLWPRAGLFGAVVVRLSLCNYRYLGGWLWWQWWRYILCGVEAAQGGATNPYESYSRSDSVCVAHTQLQNSTTLYRHFATKVPRVEQRHKRTITPPNKPIPGHLPDFIFATPACHFCHAPI